MTRSRCRWHISETRGGSAAPSWLRGVFLGLLVLLVFSAPATASREIVLVTGEVLRATIVERTGDRVIVRHPVLGELRIAVADIRTIDGRPVDPVPAPASGDAAPAGQTPAPARPSEAVRDEDADGDDGDEMTIEPIVRPPAVWESRVELGFSASSGTSDDLRLRVGWGATRTDHRNRLRLDAALRYGTSRGKRTESAVTAGTFSEWKAPEAHWSVFLQSRGDYDEFQAWEYRLSGAGGLAYRLVELHRQHDDLTATSIFVLSARFGAGAARRFGLQRGDAFVPEGLLALVGDWKINTRMSLGMESTYYPDLQEFSNFRTLSSANWTVRLDHAKGVDFRIGVTHAYERDSSSAPRNDLTAFASIMLTF